MTSNRFRRAMATRDALRRQRRQALELVEGDSAALAQNPEQRGQGDDADLDQQDDPLGGVHDPGSTL